MKPSHIKTAGLLILLTMSLPIALKAQMIAENASFNKVSSGYEFTEGPYWHPDGYLLFSDIPANKIFKWKPGQEKSNVFLSPSGHSNGITATPEGDLLIAQHDGKISKVVENKKLKVLADSYEGKRLNSPNDLTVASSGTIYFTDPPFGVSKENRELDFSGVYMLTPDGKPQLMYDGFSRPNGIVLNPEESKVYVNDTATGQIMVFDRTEKGRLVNGRKFASVGASDKSGAADGMIVDRKGNLYTTGPGGIYVFSSNGEQLQFIETPARATNLGWGGSDLKTVFVTTPAAVYSIRMANTGFKR